MAEFAPAKINLHLHVTGRRDDGFHLLDSLVVFADIGDRLSVSPADRLSVSVTGPFSAALQGEVDNLVLRAARALAAQAGVAAHGHLVLEKNLPVASGIGGGSADAAAALRLLCRFWGLRLGQAELAAVARGLGADVLVCLGSEPMLMSGIGEILAPIARLPDVGLLLVNPGVAVSTPTVFRARTGPFSAPAVFPREGFRDASALLTTLRLVRNDLEPSARLLASGIDDALAMLTGISECLLARMSGSGATCFGLFETSSAARNAAAKLQRTGWWVCGAGLIRGHALEASITRHD